MEYGLIGEHLGHSFSKDIHGQIADYEYELKEIAKEDIDAFMKAKDFKGINVTIPYKQTVIPYLDYIDDNAKAIGAVNCIVNNNGVLTGYNTDFDGMRALILRNDLDLKDKKVLVLGTGGTSHTANAVAKSLGAKDIYTVSRKAGENVITYDEAVKEHCDTSVIINTTPVGMYPNTNGSPIDIGAFKNLEGVIDAIFNPLRTDLVMSALNTSLKSEGGLYMLVVQAVCAAEHFFNKTIDSNISDRIYKNILSSKENIVLVGMPGSGKSAVSRKLSELTGKEVVDTDALIVKKSGMEITDIFSKYGEDYFRNLETEVIGETSQRSGIIISTGGGAVLRNENVRLLKKNGKVFFIDRPLKDLLPTSDRPLANSAEKITALYETRYPIYLSSADKIIKVTGDVKQVADSILEICNED